MKKRIIVFLLILGLLLPFCQGIAVAVSQDRTIIEEQLAIQGDPSEKQTVLNNDYATVTAAYEEIKEGYLWTIEFEKKASNTASRLRLAIDTSALSDSGFGTVSDIRGEGLRTITSDENKLATMKLADDEQNLDWYYSEGYSTSAKDGKIFFTLSKTSVEGELPLVIAVDKEIGEAEIDTTESVEKKVSPQAAPSPLKDVKTAIDLGPFSDKDPFPYIQPESDVTLQRRYPEIVTNHFASAKDFANDGLYTSGKQKDLFNDLGEIITDTDSIKDKVIIDGGANWRNYDYAASHSEDPAEKYAENVQLWGTDRNFSNSYLNYNGAYLKKWVEPITTHVEGDQDDTSIYNVYIDIIGGTVKEQRPIDIVFVLDRSSSMEIPINGVRKDAAMTAALTATIKQLFNTPGLDIRVGLVDFGSDGTTVVKSAALPLTNSENAVIESEVLKNQAYSKSGTPLTLGIKRGYETLYKDNGLAGRTPEKVLIVVGDGTPTFSYSGFRYRSNNFGDFSQWTIDDKAADYWVKDSGNNFIRNYENNSFGDFKSQFDPEELYPTEFDISKRPENIPGSWGFSGKYYRYGEVTSSQTSGNWYGGGNSITSNSENKFNAVQTIAYHHWKRDKMVERYGIEPKVYSIGVGLDGNRDQLNGVGDALGRNVLKNIADLKPDSEVSHPNENSYYYGADSQEELLTALTQIFSKFETSITNAILYDATGRNVSLYNPGNASQITYWHLDENDNPNETTKYKEPVEWKEEHGPRPDVVAHPTTYVPDEEGVTEKNHAYRFDGISLGEGDMVRIRYQAKLDDSSQNGNFYTVNDEAYLINEKDYQSGETQTTNRMYIPAPSIRFLAKDRNLHINKKDEQGNGIAGITLGLYEKNENDDYVLIEYMVTDSKGNASSKKQFSSEDNKIYKTYYVKELAGPEYYQVIPDYLAFTIQKMIAEQEELLDHFELVNPTSGTLVEDNDTENLWKYAYVGDFHKFTITQTLTKPTEGPQVYDKLFVNLDLVNKMKPIQVEVHKIVEGTQTALPGAMFSLQQENADAEGNYREIGRGQSDSSGIVRFENENQQVNIKETIGVRYTNFRIVETKAPDGYVQPNADDYWEIQLDYQNKVIKHRKNGESQWQRHSYNDLITEDGSLIKLSFDVTNKMTSRDFKIRKLDQNGNPLTGVGFELVRNEDVNQELFKAYSGIDGYQDNVGLLVNDLGVGTFYAKNRET